MTHKMFDRYFGNNEIYNIIGNPVGLFANVNENVSTVLQLLSVEQYKEFLELNTFNFYDIISKSSLGDEAKADIINNYNSLCDKITEFHPHIEFAAGIFQLNNKLPSYSTNDTFEFVNHFIEEQEEEDYDRPVVVNISLNDTFKSYLSIFNSACYDSCTDFVRKWYLKSKSELIRNLFLTKAIVNPESREIETQPLLEDDEKKHNNYFTK